jgi:hypothetical protein
MGNFLLNAYKAILSYLALIIHYEAAASSINMIDLNTRNFRQGFYSRPATDEELVDLAQYVLDKQCPFGTYGEDEVLEMEQMIKNAFVAVCDNFIGQKLMVVVWGYGTDWYECLTWDEHHYLEPHRQNEMVEVEE